MLLDDLSEFIDRWEAIEHFRDEWGWGPFTQGMLCVKVTMLEELRDIHYGHGGDPDAA